MNKVLNEGCATEAVRVLELEGRAILECARRLGMPEMAESFDRAISTIQSALTAGGKIVVTGVGKSGKVAEKIAATLCSTGSFAVFLHPTEGMHGDLGVLRAGDVVLALSYTGNTEEILRLMPAIQRIGAKVIALTGGEGSRLAELADVFIDGHVEQEACPNNLAPTASTTLALALGDAIAVALMRLRGFDAEAFARNHPGGSLGKRLHLRIRDVMHSGKAIAFVEPSATMEKVVAESTRSHLGAVVVTQGGAMQALQGIITDGDIRRALSKKEKFFDLRAEDVMTRTPVHIAPEAMATEGLDLMENRTSQISVLPVLDAQGCCVGLVRLHDLLRAF